MSCPALTFSPSPSVSVPLPLAAASTYQHPGFTTPLVPWLPAIGVSFNYFLLAQLSWEGIRDLMLYLAASLLLYLLYGYRNSVGGRNGYVLTV